MRLFGRATLLAIIISIAGCRPSEPASPLILGSNPPDMTLGLRNLTASQALALQKGITSAGESCSAVKQALLADLDPAGREAWEVQCPEASYSVQVRADATPATAVQRCYAGVPVVYPGDRLCAEPVLRSMHRDSRSRNVR